MVHGATPFAITVLWTFITPLWIDGKGFQRCWPDEAIGDEDYPDKPVGRRTRRLPLPYAINLRHNRIEKRLTAGAAPDRHRSRKIGDHGYPPLDAPKHVICHTDGKAVSY